MSIEDNKHAENPNSGIKSKLGFVRDGATKLPPGFRFQPTDQEIVFEYLLRKVFACPLPASIIPEMINICKFNPWDLPGGGWEQERYFFSKIEAKYGHGNRVNRKSSNGYWKTSGFDKHITRCCNNLASRKNLDMIAGIKKTLVFYKSKPSTTRTHWIMHEYRLVHSPTSQTTNDNDKKYWIPVGNWALCHILLNKRSKKSVAHDDWKILGSREQVITSHPKFTRSFTALMDCDEASSCSSSSSCGSSVVTHEVSSSRKPSYHDETKFV